MPLRRTLSLRKFGEKQGVRYQIRVRSSVTLLSPFVVRFNSWAIAAREFGESIAITW
jgi:hypothetical protein